MSETVAAAEAGPSAGAVLRQAREQAGMHVAALAGALKVPQRQIEALEQDRLDQLPDVVYARALAASICRNLRLDPQQVLARLPKGGDSRLGRDEPINVPFRASGDASRISLRDLVSRPPVMGALALLAGAVVLLLLPLIPNRTTQDPQATAETPVASPAMPAASAGLVSQIVTPPGIASAEPVPAVVPLVPATPVAPEPSTPPAAPARAEAPAASASAAVLAIHAGEASWVQVTDARGTVHLRRMLAAGEKVDVPVGATPLSVTVGSARGTQVLVRGQAFDLKPYIRDNVARFEVR